MTNPNSSHSAGISETTATGQKLRSDFFIEIHRGRTEFPSRPIGLPQFLIGAGVECDLRLGGTQMPAVHSRLFVEEDTLHVEAIESVPPLRLNGRTVNKGVLLDGDTLTIGSFEFIVHRRAAQRQELPVSDAALLAEAELADHFEVDDFEMQDLETLSAAELLDRIEKEQAFVDAFENRQRLGARALLNSVRERMHVTEPELVSDELDSVIPIPTTEGEVAEDEENLSAGLQQLLVQLTSLSQALEQRSARLSRREAGYAEAVTLLMNAQEKLASQLDFLSTRLATIQEETPESKSSRASA